MKKTNAAQVQSQDNIVVFITYVLETTLNASSYKRKLEIITNAANRILGTKLTLSNLSERLENIPPPTPT